MIANEYMRSDRGQALGFQLVTHHRQLRRRLRGVAQRRDFKPRAGEIAFRVLVRRQKAMIRRRISGIEHRFSAAGPFKLAGIGAFRRIFCHLIRSDDGLISRRGRSRPRGAFPAKFLNLRLGEMLNPYERVLRGAGADYFV